MCKNAESPHHVTRISVERGGSNSVASDVFGEIAAGTPAASVMNEVFVVFSLPAGSAGIVPQIAPRPPSSSTLQFIIHRCYDVTLLRMA